MACKGSGVQIPSAPPQVRGPLRRRPPANPGPRAADTVAAASVAHWLVSDPGECGAVMVRSGFQQADDPQLAVRDAEATANRFGSWWIATPAPRPQPVSWTTPRPPSSPWLMTSTPHTWKAARAGHPGADLRRGTPMTRAVVPAEGTPGGARDLPPPRRRAAATAVRRWRPPPAGRSAGRRVRTS